MVCLHKLVVIFAAFICSVKGRAVNISNTWVLPEEGFPVFYRYFRDRISWYEADAVCQFHHGNLVTVDTTTQFDAVRAYLKELDIVNNVWIGLTRPSDKTTFSWSGEKPQPLSGEGFWGEASAVPGIAVCAATDPAADFRWHALTCGGPEVASFICELSVPSWALGANGCMLTSLPSLTVIYLPEQTALELTSDCGLDGTKRIACKGKADQQEMMRQLSCGITHEDFDDKAVSKAPLLSTTTTSDSHNNVVGNNNNINSVELLVSSSRSSAATKPWIWTSNTIDTSEYGSPTRHRRETEDTYSTAAGGISTTTETTTTTTTRKFVTSHPMPETNRQRPSTKSPEPLTTTLKPLNTLDREVSSTMETSSTEDSSNQNPAEYASINQGQLFSIIENGTMFDIIEVNDTSDSDLKTTAKAQTPSHGTIIDTLLTTKIPLTLTTEYSKLSKLPKTGTYNKSPNDLSDGQSEKTFMKAIEIEAFPMNSLNTSSLVKLNRTNRKELPLPLPMGEGEAENEDTTEHTDFKQIDRDLTIPIASPSVPSKSVDHSHQHKIVEITITDIERKTDATKFYVTTKKYDKTRGNTKKKEVNEKEKMLKKNLTADININIEISELPAPVAVAVPVGDNLTDTDAENNVTLANDTIEANEANEANETNEGNDITDVNETEENVQIYIDSNNLTRSAVNRNTDMRTTEEPMEPIPEAQPRPNRNRVLTRPQRRSFYPYFFSRVLG